MKTPTMMTRGELLEYVYDLKGMINTLQNTIAKMEHNQSQSAQNQSVAGKFTDITFPVDLPRNSAKI
jgi:hypothetical protein